MLRRVCCCSSGVVSFREEFSSKRESGPVGLEQGPLNDENIKKKAIVKDVANSIVTKSIPSERVAGFKLHTTALCCVCRIMAVSTNTFHC